MKTYAIEFLGKSGQMTVVEFNEDGEYLGTNYPETTFFINDAGQEENTDLELKDEFHFLLSEIISFKDRPEERVAAYLKTITGGSFDGPVYEVIENIIEDDKFSELLEMALEDEDGPI